MGEWARQLRTSTVALPGDIMHFPELEWHVFGYDEGGFLDALCIYGQVTNIRPEEISGIQE